MLPRSWPSLVAVALHARLVGGARRWLGNDKPQPQDLHRKFQMRHDAVSAIGAVFQWHTFETDKAQNMRFSGRDDVEVIQRKERLVWRRERAAACHVQRIDRSRHLPNSPSYWLFSSHLISFQLSSLMFQYDCHLLRFTELHPSMQAHDVAPS